MSRAFEVSMRGDDRMVKAIFAETAGKAKYSFLLSMREVWNPDVTFADLTCRSLGDIPVPPTRKEIAQAEADRFNAEHPVGTLLRYWSWTKEGEPTGEARIKHHATVVCESPVIWMEGVRSCHSLMHVERAA